MKSRLMVFVLAASLMAWGQGRGGGRPSGGGPPGGMRMGNSHADMGNRPADAGKPASSQSSTQHPLKSSQINGGAFRMLEKKTGMTSDQLKALYTSSGAKNFGQFVSAVVVAKNLNLDMNAVLNGLKTQSLGQTLQSLGVSPQESKKAMAQAKKEMGQANKNS